MQIHSHEHYGNSRENQLVCVCLFKKKTCVIGDPEDRIAEIREFFLEIMKRQ